MFDQKVRERRYSEEDAGEIIAIAARLDTSSGLADPGLTIADIVRIGAELGISERAVRQSLSRHTSHRRMRRLQVSGARLWRRIFQIHVFAFVTAVVFLGALDLATGGGFDFAQYVLFVWGLIVVWHAASVWWPGKRRIQRTRGGGR